MTHQTDVRPVSPNPGGNRRRHRDRRAGTGDVVERLLDAFATTPTLPCLLASTEASLRQVCPLLDVAIVDEPPRSLSSVSVQPGIVLITVPLSSFRSSLTLKIGTAAGYSPDPWDVDVLETTARVFSALHHLAHRGALSLAASTAKSPPGRSPEATGTTASSVGLIGSSAAMDALRQAIARLAPTDFTVLICGESGTGKELVARALHQTSPRRDGPFIAVNCAALVESLLEAELFGIEDRAATGVQGRPGKFELASGGTLFLDEVADLSRPAQAALLRALQDLTIERVGGHRSRHVDTRVIVATNHALGDLVGRRRFRADLFYRVSGIEISLPPLRERSSDIPELTAHFLQLHGGGDRIVAPDALEAFVRYRWPGNVRELERVVQRCLAWSRRREIGLETLPPHLCPSLQMPPIAAPRQTPLRVWAAGHVQAVFEECGRNKRLACRRLGINYRTLQSYLGIAGVRSRAA